MSSKQVSSDEFYANVGKQDVSLETVGRYPYRTNFRDKETHRIVGWSIGKGNFVPDEYYLAAREES